MKKITMILIASCLAMTGRGQGIRAGALPVATAPVNDSDYMVGTHDSAGHKVTYRYPVGLMATYMGAALGSMKGLNIVLAANPYATQGFQLGKVGSLNPYQSFYVGISSPDSAAYFGCFDTSLTYGVQGGMNSGVMEMDVVGPGSILTTNHFSGNGGTPTILVGSAAGSIGASAAIVGTDMEGYISITQGIGGSGNLVATVVFATPYTRAPRCIIVLPANDEAQESAAGVHASTSVEVDGSACSSTQFQLWRHTAMSDAPNVARYWYFVVE